MPNWLTLGRTKIALPTVSDELAPAYDRLGLPVDEEPLTIVEEHEWRATRQRVFTGELPPPDEEHPCLRAHPCKQGGCLHRAPHLDSYCPVHEGAIR